MHSELPFLHRTPEVDCNNLLVLSEAIINIRLNLTHENDRYSESFTSGLSKLREDNVVIYTVV